MINAPYVQDWQQRVKWQEPFMVEQDLIISKALVCLFSHPKIKGRLVFRGGTALNKLFLKPPARYSEDIDLVQKHPEPIGDTLKSIGEVLDPWLGTPIRKIKRGGAKRIYKFQTIADTTAKLKIEINTVEHFQVLPLQHIPYSVDSKWFQGSCEIPVYALEEMMATKLRALYQRRKGRDLFDVWLVFKNNMADIDKVIEVFLKYCENDERTISRELFQENMLLKQDNRDFRLDMEDLLPAESKWDFDEAFDFVMEKVISKLS
jgi:predicted nucleotidyltransferase component of viral defense system